jgi:hypothetical protein
LDSDLFRFGVLKTILVITLSTGGQRIRFMRIFAEHRIDKERKLRFPKEQLDKQIKNTLSLLLLGFLEDKIDVEVSDESFTETHRVELFVLSTKDVEEIGEIISSFESYVKDYGTAYPVADKLRRIKDIFLKETLQ